MAKTERQSLFELANENRVTFDGLPVVMPSGSATAFPVDGVECGHKPKKSFTLECNGAMDVYIQGRIGTSGEWCTQKKDDSDADLKFTIASGGGSVWVVSKAPTDYIRLYLVNTAGANNTISDIKVKLGR